MDTTALAGPATSPPDWTACSIMARSRTRRPATTCSATQSVPAARASWSPRSPVTSMVSLADSLEVPAVASEVEHQDAEQIQQFGLGEARCCAQSTRALPRAERGRLQRLGRSSRSARLARISGSAGSGARLVTIASSTGSPAVASCAPCLGDLAGGSTGRRSRPGAVR